MLPNPAIQQDAEHLRLLSIFHYVMSGLSVLGILFGLIYSGMGIVASRQISKMAASAGPKADPIPDFGWFFMIYGGVISTIALLACIGYFLGGRYLGARRNRTFCYVVAALSCMVLPLGTVLGIFTILVLSRPSVAALFEEPGSIAPMA
ncbi:MAG: hypothetical protein QM755_04060 [Luteolibacter sp.]